MNVPRFGGGPKDVVAPPMYISLSPFQYLCPPRCSKKVKLIQNDNIVEEEDHRESITIVYIRHLVIT